MYYRNAIKFDKSINDSRLNMEKKTFRSLIYSGFMQNIYVIYKILIYKILIYHLSYVISKFVAKTLRKEH